MYILLENLSPECLENILNNILTINFVVFLRIEDFIHVAPNMKFITLSDVAGMGRGMNCFLQLKYCQIECWLNINNSNSLHCVDCFKFKYGSKWMVKFETCFWSLWSEMNRCILISFYLFTWPLLRLWDWPRRKQRMSEL